MIILFIALHMTDEPLPMVANLQFGILKYICGFPLVIINTEYPFFLSESTFPKQIIPMVIMNIVLQVLLLEIYFRISYCIYNHRTTKTNQKYPSVNL